MSKKQVQIRVKNKNRTVVILAPVKDSLHSSLLADRINKLPYIKVFERAFFPKCSYAHIFCHAILGVFTIEKLHNDLDTMSDLIILPNETHETNLPTA